MPSSHRPVVVWFRNDLRIADQPALKLAMEQGGPVIPLFVWAPQEEEPWAPGGATRWWLHHSLDALDKSLRSIGSRLVLRDGPSLEALRAVIRETGAESVIWSRRYEPAVVARDSAIKEALRAEGIRAESVNASLLCEPWTVANKSGGPFQVFTPFWRHCMATLDPDPPGAAPASLPAPARWPSSRLLADWELLPRIEWDRGMRAEWRPGEAGGDANLRKFVAGAVTSYTEQRNRPDLPGTSRLSPHLHFGEIAPRQIWHALRAAYEARGRPAAEWKTSQFLAEVGWREFAYHLLFHFPHTPTRPLRSDFERFPWRSDPEALRAWQRGRTGYPLVDAGMRELWTTGWMHNRVRMVVGSFLVKDLLISWQEGAAWFWDTLVDADLASNTLGWQWVSGCGADAAPYFRVFNPIGQGTKFDPDGAYVRRWLPELARMPSEYIHDPSNAPPLALREAGVVLGRTYPLPIVHHNEARMAALAAFSRIRGGGA